MDITDFERARAIALVVSRAKTACHVEGPVETKELLRLAMQHEIDRQAYAVIHTLWKGGMLTLR